MTPEELERMRTTPRAHHGPDLICAQCRRPPTCPMLTDDLWASIWATDKHLESPATCTCEAWRSFSRAPTTAVQRVYRTWDGRQAEGHVRKCELVAPRRPLLCLECAESRLGRLIVAADLAACLGNYADAVAQRRMQDRIDALERELWALRETLDTVKEAVDG